jgi:hypothetical protein
MKAAKLPSRGGVEARNSSRPVFMDPRLRGDGEVGTLRRPYFTTSYPTGRAASVSHSQIEWPKLRIA